MVREEGLGRAYGSDSALSLRLFRDWRCLIYGNTYDSELTADRPREFSHRPGSRGCRFVAGTEPSLSRFQIVGITEQSCVPMTQGFFR
jgi:hypothetical protein